MEFATEPTSDPATSPPPPLPAQDRPYQSIESGYEDEAYPQQGSQSNSARNSSGADSALFDGPTRTSPTRQHSPPTSHTSDDEISLLPSTRAPSCTPHTPSHQYKQTTRPPFRTPSSVRAIQLSTTPPHLTSPPPYLLPLPSSRNSTPHSAFRSPSKRLSPGKKVRKEYPLVLLHVTLLPIRSPWSRAVMERVLSARELEAWKVLGEKVGETVAERGVLINHPREEYELLGERLLESLELVRDGEGGCGVSFVGGEDNVEGRDEDACRVCGRKEERRIWDVRVYAANGLMRAGAWEAAWKEMERVDVEIWPWIGDEVRRTLDEARDEEEVMEMGREDLAQEQVYEAYTETRKMDQDRWREIYGDRAEQSCDGLGEEKVERAEMRKGRAVDEPLWILVRDCASVAAKDRRNLAILLLGLLVIYLSLSTRSPATSLLPLQEPTSMPVVTMTEQMSHVVSETPSCAPPKASEHLPSSSMISPSMVQEERETVPTNEAISEQGPV